MARQRSIRMSSGREMRQAGFHGIRQASGSSRSTCAAGDGRRAVRPRTATPKMTHRPQRTDPPVQQQQRFLDRIVDVGRAAIARGIAADIGLGRRNQRRQRLLVPAARGIDQRGIASARFAPMPSWRRKLSAGHGAHRAKSEKSGQGGDQPGAGDQIANWHAGEAKKPARRPSPRPRPPASPAPSPANSCDKT